MPSLNTGNAILSNAIAVSSTYNVGIGGAASGSHKLQVTGATNLTGKLTINTGGTDDQFQLVGTAPSYRMTNAVTGATINGFIAMAGATNNYITGAVSGDMCIGNQNNGKILFGFGAGTATPKMTIDSNGAATFSSTATATAFIPSGSSVPSNGVYLPSANTLGFSTNSTLKMTITSGGNVGIGTSPSAWNSSFNAIQLGAYGGYISGRTNENSFFLGTNHYFDSATSNWIYTTTGAVSQMYFSGADIVFRNNVSGTAGTATGFSERMRITSGGNVGIGTSSPSSFAGYNNLSLQASTSGYNLDFFNNSGVRKAAIIYNNAVNFTLSAIESIPMNFETAGVERMSITADGLNTYIGKNATGNFQLSVDGFGNYVFNNAIGGGYRNYLNYALATYMITSNAGNTGMYMSSGGSSWNVFTSDIRVKKNFEPSQGLNELLQIEAVKYHMITDEDDAPKRLGFKAQNLLPLIPEMVTTNPMALDENGKALYTITPDYLLPVLVKAIQELKAEIEAQQQQINSLINR